MNQYNLLNHAVANCDEALIEAFVRRMNISSEFAKAKVMAGEEVYDSHAEREYIQHVVSQFSPELSLKANSLWYSLLRMDRSQQFRWILKNTTDEAPAHEALLSDGPAEGPIAVWSEYADEANKVFSCETISCGSNEEALEMLRSGKVERIVLACDEKSDIDSIYLSFYRSEFFLNASDRPHGKRRLFLLSRKLVLTEDLNRMTLAFAVNRTYGSLTQALSNLAEAKLNIEHMQLRRSIPGDGHPDDLIFIDLSGDFTSIATRAALYQFEKEMFYFRLLGFWKQEDAE